MKKTVIITSIFFTIVSFGANFIYDKFAQLNTQISDLKAVNKNLKIKNNTLANKQKEIKNKISQRKKELFQKKLNRAKKKLAKATTSAIPFVGTASVIGVTYWEMQNYCNDIKEFKKFEESIFGINEESISEEEKALCGYDYQTIEKIVFKDINMLKEDTQSWAFKTYEEWKYKINSELILDKCQDETELCIQ